MENATKKPDFSTAYDVGKQAVLGMPRWNFLVLVLLGVVTEKGLVAKYSLPGFKAYPLSVIAVVCFGGRLCDEIGFSQTPLLR